MKASHPSSRSLLAHLLVGGHVPDPLEDFALARLLDLARQDVLVQDGVDLCLFVRLFVCMCL